MKWNTNDAMMDRDFNKEGKYFVVNYPCINQKIEWINCELKETPETQWDTIESGVVEKKTYRKYTHAASFVWKGCWVEKYSNSKRIKQSQFTFYLKLQ